MKTPDAVLHCNPLLYGSLFSGIGGIDLGFDRAGLKCAWQVEIDPFARKVLTKHWPEVPKHDDIRTFQPTPVDVVAGGFPCQDISNAGKRVGIGGERSGLWSEMFRVVCEARPKFVVVENVAALLTRGMGVVLGDLASIGYDAEWFLLPAGALGAPHFRCRVFIVAYAGMVVSDACVFSDSCKDWRERWGHGNTCDRTQEWYVYREGCEPSVPRVAHGVSSRVDRLRGLGNAVVPQVAEWIGRRLIESV